MLGFFSDVFLSQFLRNCVTCLGSCEVFFLLMFIFGLMLLHGSFSVVTVLHYYFVNSILYKTNHWLAPLWMTEKLSSFRMKRENISPCRTWTKLFCPCSFFLGVGGKGWGRVQVEDGKNIWLQTSGLICRFSRSWNAEIWSGHEKYKFPFNNSYTF